MSSASLDFLINLDALTEHAIRNLFPFGTNHNFQCTNEESSDDSEVDFSFRLEDSYMDPSSNAPPGWNRDINLLSEVNYYGLLSPLSWAFFSNIMLQDITRLKEEVIDMFYNIMMLSRRNNFVAKHR